MAIHNYAPDPYAGALSNDALSDVCLLRTSGITREQ